MLRRIAPFLMLGVLGAAAPHPAMLRGTLAFPGVVWLSDASTPAPVGGAMITQTGKAFAPGFAVVTAGSDVRFRNDDAVDHSVYSVSKADPFDLGIYEPGPGKDVRFANAGIVEVRCHIHRHMHATLVVVDGPYARVEAPNGRWTLRAARPGRHLLHTWTVEQGETTKTIDVR